MRADEFLKMMRQDNETLEKEKDLMLSVVDCMAEVLKGCPAAEINPELTAMGCYEHLKKIAQKKQKSGAYCMPPEESKKLISEYLGIDLEKSSEVKLEDFF